MRTLIIPDLHHRTDHADHWLATEKYDRVVFLGDYFDSFDDETNDARQTAIWLRNRMETTDDIFLLGNHDAAYLFPDDPALECEGFTCEKAAAIGEILQPHHWHRLELAWEEQGWLLSHAGFHPVWIDIPSVPRILARCRTAMELARRSEVDPILGYGEKPGGIQRYGGPLWMDWASLQPIAGIHQIVGHSSDDQVRENSTLESRNFCLDVNNASAAAILSDGEIRLLSLD